MRVLLIKENRKNVITRRYFHKVEKLIFFPNIYVKIKFFDKYGNLKEELMDYTDIVGIEVVEENDWI